MYSLAFPDMFTTARTKLISNHEATASNLRLLLGSQRTSLMGDPYFGSKIKSYVFNQGNVILQDIIIDDIYTTITNYMPQVQLNRNNITVELSDKDNYTLNATINCINKQDYTINTYKVKLLDEE